MPDLLYKVRCAVHMLQRTDIMSSGVAKDRFVCSQLLDDKQDVDQESERSLHDAYEATDRRHEL